MTDRECFLNLMQCKAAVKIPNYELGLWWQTDELWKASGYNLGTDFRPGKEEIGIDRREFLNVNFGMLPAFEYKILEAYDNYSIVQGYDGIIKKVYYTGGLREARIGMDEFIEFPVKTREDFLKIKKRYEFNNERYKEGYNKNINNDFPLFLGLTKPIYGFYSQVREWMGIENAAYGWYDTPSLMEEMMEFVENFIISVSEKALKENDNIDAVIIHDDYGAKGAPVLSPEIFEKFIYPHFKKVVSFLKTKIKYVTIAFNGNAEILIPYFLNAGIDAIHAVEVASGMDPFLLRKKFGKTLGIWGGVDKRRLMTGDFDEYIYSFKPLCQEGRFIPMIDHAVSPDIPLENFLKYLKIKSEILSF